MIRDGIKVSMDHFYPIRDGLFPIRDRLNARSGASAVHRLFVLPSRVLAAGGPDGCMALSHAG
jgi:hypothetical protein